MCVCPGQGGTHNNLTVTTPLKEYESPFPRGHSFLEAGEGEELGIMIPPPPHPWRIIDRPSSVQILLKELEAKDGSSDVECHLLHVPVWFPAFLFHALCSIPFLQTICEYLQHIGKYLQIFMNYSFRSLAMPGIEGYIWNFRFLDYLWWVMWLMVCFLSSIPACLACGLHYRGKQTELEVETVFLWLFHPIYLLCWFN